MPGSYWCALDHSLPFLQIILHPEILELARQLEGDEDIYLRNGGINELAPGKSFWWHRDSEMAYTEFMHYFSALRWSIRRERLFKGNSPQSHGFRG